MAHASELKSFSKGDSCVGCVFSTFLKQEQLGLLSDLR
ncbi:MAG: hypothetical protein JWQ27_202 [Ferruginibacter sp.]|nr:hypothetical protein [Ferruginibacter sp.]